METFIWLLVCEAQAKEGSQNGFDKGVLPHIEMENKMSG